MDCRTIFNLWKPSGLSTTRFNIKQTYILYTEFFFVCFVRFAEQTATISIFNIKLLFTTETDHVYYTVRTKSLNIIQDNLSPSRGNLWRTEWQWNRLFSEYLDCTLSASFSHCSILIFIYTLLLPDKRAKPGNLPKKPVFCQILGSVGKKILLLSP
jgi:hypothetical protein